MKQSDISPHLGTIIGCLVKEQRPLMCSDFMRLYRTQFMDLPSPFPQPEDVRPETRAVIHFDIGMKQGEEAGLLDTFYDGNYRKMVRLTPEGIKLVAQ